MNRLNGGGKMPSPSLRKLRRTFLLLASGWLVVMLLECLDSTRYSQYQKSTVTLRDQKRTRKDKLVEEWSLLLKKKDEQKKYYRTKNNDVCKVWPGLGREEGGYMGYQVLLRMRFFSAIAVTPTEPNVLCVWFVDQRGHEAATFYETARNIYQRECQGTLQVNITVQKQSSALLSDGDYHSIAISSFRPIELKYVFKQISKLRSYDWFHWTDPQKYLLLPQNLRWLLSPVKRQDSPKTFQSWVMRNPEVKSEYHQLFGQTPANMPGCESPRTANLAAAKVLSQCRQNLPTAKKDPLSLLQLWMAACYNTADIACLRHNPRRDRHTKWMFLLRYFELDLARDDNLVPPNDDKIHTDNAANTSVDFSLRRLHTILNGGCDSVWDHVIGALDQNGKPGYVHDVTFLRQNPLPFQYHPDGDDEGVCDVPLGEGDEGENGIKGLKKIKIDGERQAKTKILCMVYTQSNGHFRVQAIAETWGVRCDGFFAASNATDPAIGAVNLAHEGPEEYDNMWLKVRAMFQYAYDHYLDDFDLFHIGGDDHYLIPENLRYIAEVGSWSGPWNNNEPLLLGGSLALNSKLRYCNGGSGYTINRAALHLLVENLLTTPRCMPHWRSSKEDRLMSGCFRSAGILCTDTNDGRNETRYHTWNVDQHASWRIGTPGQDWKKLVNFHGIAWKEGLGQISETSVSFHLKKNEYISRDSGMRRYHAILYGLCPEPNKEAATP